MELNNNLISVQGILVNCLKKTGEFTKITYRGGNEERILYIALEITKYLTSRGYFEDKKPKKTYTKELNEIVFFLALNTIFKKPPNLDEYSHLTNIIPQLSKCLLANICFGLDLVKQYGYVIEEFPLEVTEELLDEIIECLRKGKPKEHLDGASVVLKAVANKLSAVELSHKTEDIINDLIKLVNIILQNILSLSSDDAKNMSQNTIYLHMGYILLDLFELLLYIDENVPSLKAFLGCVLYTTSSMIKCITLNVFCSWAEVEYDDQMLQTIVSGKAYLVLEKYQKNKLASEVVSMLGAIARKPKSIQERILEADLSTMIKKVDDNDENQKLWFRALLNTPIFQNSKVVSCIRRWWKLCEKSDLNRLLTVPLPSGAEERQLITRCASNLTLKDLHNSLTIYFHREKFIWNENIQEKLVPFFNQVHTPLSEDELKEALLLMLQNAQMFFIHFYTTAFKRSQDLMQIFDLVQDIAKIDHIGHQALMQVLHEYPPDSQNVGNYLKLFDSMLTCQFYSWDFIVSEILLKLLDHYRKDENHLEEFCSCIQILKHFDTLSCELPKELELLQYILICISDNRCKSFFQFNGLKEEITRRCVEYILKKREDLEMIVGNMEYFSVLGENLEDPWTNYYKNLFTNEKDMNLIDYLLPDFNLTLYTEEKSDENFVRLLKLLPRCVSVEWRILLKEIEDKCGFAGTLNALTDIMILLCDFSETQEKYLTEVGNQMILALKFSLQNYGRFLVLDSKSKQDQILAINNVCRVLKHIPDQLKSTEGMSLINVLPEETLGSLAEDKEFVAKIVLINDKQICKALAQKVLGAR